MEQENFDNSNERPIESVYSTRIRAGKRRTYFFDVRATRSNDYFLTITESRKRFDNNGYDRHKIFIYKEDFNKFIKAVTEAMDFVKTELMPDFDFDAFNHEEDPNTPEQGVRYTAPQEVSENSAPVLPATAPTPQVVEAIPDAPAAPEVEIDPASITEKKPLEARDSPASQGDNMSQEEVEKW
jgi:hypothetical protein